MTADKNKVKIDLKRVRGTYWNSGVMGGLMVLVAVICVLVRGPSQEGPVGAPAVTEVSSGWVKAFEKAAGLETGARVTYWSDYLGLNPQSLLELGDGPQINDIAPAVFDHFNSLTYVECVMALSHSDRPEQFFEKLISIRYKNAQAGFFSRNHSAEADWIPNNEQAGNLDDITARLADKAGIRPENVTVSADRGIWVRAQEKLGGISRSIAALAEHQGVNHVAWFAPRKASLIYIPISKIPKIYDSIPSGIVINFVHESRDDGSVSIAARGIAVRVGGELLLKHASPEGLIKTTALKEYLRESAGIVGINLNQVNR